MPRRPGGVVTFRGDVRDIEETIATILAKVYVDRRAEYEERREAGWTTLEAIAGAEVLKALVRAYGGHTVEDLGRPSGN